MATLSTSSVEALTDRLVALDRKIDGVEQRLTTRLDKVDARLVSMESKLDLALEKLDSLGA